MNNDHLDPINALHMPELADMTLAVDLLIRAKDGVRNTAFALTESASPHVRETLRRQLRQSIDYHGRVAALMTEKRWFHPYAPEEQYQLDQLAANNTLKIGRMKLYREDTSRKGMFDRTPDQDTQREDK